MRIQDFEIDEVYEAVDQTKSLQYCIDFFGVLHTRKDKHSIWLVSKAPYNEIMTTEFKKWDPTKYAVLICERSHHMEESVGMTITREQAKDAIKNLAALWDYDVELTKKD